MSLIHKSQNGVNSTRKDRLLYEKAILLSAHTGPVYCTKFSPDGESLASAGLDKSILLWSLPRNIDNETPNYGQIDGHKGGITSLSWPMQSKIYSTSADTTVSLWDAETGQRLKTNKGHELTVNDCSANIQGMCVSVGDDGTLRVWDERERYEVKRFETPYPLLSCDLSRDGTFAYFAGIDPNIKALDIRKGNVIWSCTGSKESITSLALSADESMLVIKAMDGSVQTVNAKRSVPTGISRLGQSYDGAEGGKLMTLSRARFSKDDVYVCSASDDASAVFWSTASKRIVSKVTGHTGAVTDIDFHPSERIMSSCSVNGEVIVREF